MSAENHKRGLTMLKEGFGIIEADPQPTAVVKWINHVTIQLREVRQLQRSVEADIHLKRQCETITGELLGLKTKFEKLQKIGRGDQQQLSERAVWKDIQSTFKKRIQTGVIINLEHRDAHTFLTDAELIFSSTIKKTLLRKTSVKVNTVLAAEYAVMRNDVEFVETKYFNTDNQPILRTTDIQDWFKTNVSDKILHSMEEFQERDSGWKLRSITNLAVNINQYNPMRGSCYIELPDEIKAKKACVNVRNRDNECYKWAVLAALHPVTKNHNRVVKYKKYENEVNFKDIVFPVTLRDVSKFELQNTVSINVYILRKKIIAPVHITKLKKEQHVNLLIVREDEEEEDDDDEEEESTNFHYVWIRSLSRLVSSQLSRNEKKKHTCDRCLHYFYSVEKLTSHEQDCAQINKCRVELPKPPGDKVEFKNLHHKERVPFIIYADFECLLKKVYPTQQSNTTPYHDHEAFSVGYFLHCSHDSDLSRYNSYRGPKPAEWLSEQLLQIAERLETVYDNPKPMDPLTEEEERAFLMQSVCHICGKPLDELRVRDHCHLTGRYRGAAHQGCNVTSITMTLDSNDPSCVPQLLRI